MTSDSLGLPARNMAFGFIGTIVNFAALILLVFSKKIKRPLRISLCSALLNGLVYTIFLILYASIKETDMSNDPACLPILILLYTNTIIMFCTTVQQTIYNFCAVFFPIKFRIRMRSRIVLLSTLCCWGGGLALSLACVKLPLPPNYPCLPAIGFGGFRILGLGVISVASSAVVLVLNVGIIMKLRNRHRIVLPARAAFTGRSSLSNRNSSPKIASLSVPSLDANFARSQTEEMGKCPSLSTFSGCYILPNERGATTSNTTEPKGRNVFIVSGYVEKRLDKANNAPKVLESEDTLKSKMHKVQKHRHSTRIRRKHPRCQLNTDKSNIPHADYSHDTSPGTSEFTIERKPTLTFPTTKSHPISRAHLRDTDDSKRNPNRALSVATVKPGKLSRKSVADTKDNSLSRGIWGAVKIVQGVCTTRDPHALTDSIQLTEESNRPTTHKTTGTAAITDSAKLKDGCNLFSKMPVLTDSPELKETPNLLSGPNADGPAVRSSELRETFNPSSTPNITDTAASADSRKLKDAFNLATTGVSEKRQVKRAICETHRKNTDCLGKDAMTGAHIQVATTRKRENESNHSGAHVKEMEVREPPNPSGASVNDIESCKVDHPNPSGPSVKDIESCKVDHPNPSGASVKDIESCKVDHPNPSGASVKDIESCKVDHPNPSGASVKDIESCKVDYPNPSGANIKEIELCEVIHPNPSGSKVKEIEADNTKDIAGEFENGVSAVKLGDFEVLENAEHPTIPVQELGQNNLHHTFKCLFSHVTRNNSSATVTPDINSKANSKILRVGLINKRPCHVSACYKARKTNVTLIVLTLSYCLLNTPVISYLMWLASLSYRESVRIALSPIGFWHSTLMMANTITIPCLYAWRFIDWNHILKPCKRNQVKKTRTKTVNI